MTTRMIALIGALMVAVLAGCTHQLASCQGPIYPLNVGQWQPTPEDLK